jgi:hypothetical protein
LPNRVECLDPDELPPLAPSVLFQRGNKSVKAKHGDALFELDTESSLEVLRLLEGYDWPKDDITDIGLTLEKGAPRLGVLTIRHLNLAMLLNYHVGSKLKGYHWSTIAIDARAHLEGERKWQQRKLSTLLTMGCYTDGGVYSTDGGVYLFHRRHVTDRFGHDGHGVCERPPVLLEPGLG